MRCPPRTDAADTLDLDPVTSAVPFAVARLRWVVNIRQDVAMYVATAYRAGEMLIARAPDA